MLPLQSLGSVSLIATDVDGTLTLNGQFPGELIPLLERLHTAGIKVVLVTGRSAGWVSALVNYLPVCGAISENGGLAIEPDGTRHLLVDIADAAHHRDRLRETFEQLQVLMPSLSAAADNLFRITDWTFDLDGLAEADIQRLAEAVAVLGWDFTYSTVQGHIMPRGQNKATGLGQYLKQMFPTIDRDRIVTVGDSPNDESMFQHFACSVGVANVQHYQATMQHLPTYVMRLSEFQGFAEMADSLLMPAQE